MRIRRHPARPGQSAGPACRWMRAVVSSVALAGTLVGCAALSCTPQSIVVVKKDERARLDTTPRGVRETETGKVEEIRPMTPVRDYWVQSAAGTWYRVTAEQFRSAEVNRPFELCQ